MVSSHAFRHAGHDAFLTADETRPSLAGACEPLPSSVVLVPKSKASGYVTRGLGDDLGLVSHG